MKHSDFDHDSWTCQRANDKSLFQLDFFIGAMAFQIHDTWNDFAVPTGLDHRCAHCILHLPVPRPGPKTDRGRGLKHWVPYFGFVSIHVAAAHVYVLTPFVGKIGKCFDGSWISRRRLLQDLFQI